MKKKEGEIEKRREKMRKSQRFSPFFMQFCLFNINLYYSNSFFCRTLEDQ